MTATAYAIRMTEHTPPSLDESAALIWGGALEPSGGSYG